MPPPSGDGNPKATTGNNAVLPRRLGGKESRDNNDGPNAKRLKSVADELVCPITLELPIDPVTAEDGHVYERSAIEQHVKTQHGRQLRSPMTNETMGKRLLPALQHKNLIEALIACGTIAGTMAKKWTKKVEDIKFKEIIMKKAEGGDPEAMYLAGVGCSAGQRGFQQNHKTAYEWFKKAHAAGSVKGTALLGYSLCEGLGVAVNHKNGIMFLSLAAGTGSNYAALHLGLALAEGRYGLAVDSNEAIIWLKKSYSDCPHKHNMLQSVIDEAKQQLQELQN